MVGAQNESGNDDYLGLAGAATAFATVTIFFAAGETIGPAGAGIIAKMTGTFTTAYLAASALTAGGSGSGSHAAAAANRLTLHY